MTSLLPFLRRLPSTRTGFIISGLMVILMGGTLFAATWKASSASRLATLSQKVLQAIGDVEVNAARAESAHRDRLLAGLEGGRPEHDEMITLLGAAAALSGLTKDDDSPLQHARAREIAALLDQQLGMPLLSTPIHAITQLMEHEELRLLEARRREEIERRVLVRWVLVCAVLVSLSVLGFAYAGFARELRERERAQRRLHDLAENLPLMVYQMRTGRPAGPVFEFVGHDALDLHGVQSQGRLPEPACVWNTIFEEDKAGYSQALEVSTRTLCPLDWEYRVKVADDSLRWVRSCASLRRDNDGSILWNGYWADVTERKQFGLALEQAKDEADAANRAKTIFLATMSHEIRTPMNGLMAMLELLGLSRLDHEQRTMLGTVRESGRSLLRIVDDILDFSKIEAGGLNLNPEVASVRRMIERVLEAHSGAASGKGLRLCCSVDPEIAAAHRFDALRLSQLVGNFVSNAVKFTDRGSVEINAQRLATSDGAQTLRLSVTDTGVGVSDEQRARLFRPFAQAEPGTARRFGGTGLGLAICTRLAALMDGSIAMASTLGHGTTISVTLSLPTADARELPQIDGELREDGLRKRLATRRVAPRIETAQADGTLVLVVDDHPTNRLVLLRQVAALGYAAESAADGPEALGLWRSGRFAIVLTDCNMPEMDGYELARRIRDEEAASGAKPIPIIACTANALDGAAQHCMDAGMDDYLAKPIDLADLMRTLDRWRPVPDTLPAAMDGPVNSPRHARATPLDHEALAAISGGCADTEHAILLDFRRANDGDALMLRQAVAQADAPMTTRMAHRIKGASSMVGARRLATVCEGLEASSRGGDWGAIKDRMAEFQLEMQSLNNYLDAA